MSTIPQHLGCRCRQNQPDPGRATHPRRDDRLDRHAFCRGGQGHRAVLDRLRRPRRSGIRPAARAASWTSVDDLQRNPATPAAGRVRPRQRASALQPAPHPEALRARKLSFSVPIFRADGSFFGTLCAIDSRRSELDDPALLKTVELLAELIGRQLEIEEDLETSRNRLIAAERSSELREQVIAAAERESATCSSPSSRASISCARPGPSMRRIATSSGRSRNAASRSAFACAASSTAPTDASTRKRPGNTPRPTPEAKPWPLAVDPGRPDSSW